MTAPENTDQRKAVAGARSERTLIPRPGHSPPSLSAAEPHITGFNVGVGITRVYDPVSLQLVKVVVSQASPRFPTSCYVCGPSVAHDG